MGQGNFIHHRRRVIYNRLHLASVDYITMHMSGPELKGAISWSSRVGKFLSSSRVKYSYMIAAVMWHDYLKVGGQNDVFFLGKIQNRDSEL